MLLYLKLINYYYKTNIVFRLENAIRCIIVMILIYYNYIITKMYWNNYVCLKALRKKLRVWSVFNNVQNLIRNVLHAEMMKRLIFDLNLIVLHFISSTSLHIMLCNINLYEYFHRHILFFLLTVTFVDSRLHLETLFMTFS